MLPTYGVMMYAVIAEPLFDAALHLTTALLFRGDAKTAVGTPGEPIVIGADSGDSGPIPRALRAATVKVNVVPFASPLIVPVVAVELKVVNAFFTPDEK